MRGTGSAKRALVERYIKLMEIALHDIDNSFDLNGDDQLVSFRVPRVSNRIHIVVQPCSRMNHNSSSIIGPLFLQTSTMDTPLGNINFDQVHFTSVHFYVHFKINHIAIVCRVIIQFQPSLLRLPYNLFLSAFHILLIPQQQCCTVNAVGIRFNLTPKCFQPM